MARTKEESSERNWNKARLIGFGLSRGSLTPREIEILEEMLALKKTLLEAWDENSEIFLGHPLKNFKCYYCGKRTNKEYIVENVNACRIHYHIFKKEEGDGNIRSKEA